MGCSALGIGILELDEPDVVGQLDDPIYRLHAVRQAMLWAVELPAADTWRQRELPLDVACRVDGAFNVEVVQIVKCVGDGVGADIRVVVDSVAG